jgi:hypothetical protein
MDERTYYIAEVLKGATTVEDKRERIHQKLESERASKAHCEAIVNAPEAQDVRQPQLPHPVARKEAKAGADACARHIQWLQALEAELKAPPR